MKECDLRIGAVIPFNAMRTRDHDEPLGCKRIADHRYVGGKHFTAGAAHWMLELRELGAGSPRGFDKTLTLGGKTWGFNKMPVHVLFPKFIVAGGKLVCFANQFVW